MNDKYEVINKEEPRGQSVAENGIPCTARHCVTQLNRLSRDNEKLEKEVIVLKDKLKSIKFVVMCYNSELTKELFKENSFPEEIIKYIKYFETFEEYESWINIEENAEEVYRTEEKIFKKCVENLSKKGVTPDYELLRYIHKLEKEREDLEFHKATQEALDRCDDSKKGMSVEEFFKELDSW